MKNYGRVIGALLLLLAASVPAYAAVEAAGGTAKTLSFIEFSALPQNYGIHGRTLEWKFNEYRKGRLPVSTLDVSHMR